jgi:hypothetical protein
VVVDASVVGVGSDVVGAAVDSVVVDELESADFTALAEAPHPASVEIASAATTATARRLFGRVAECDIGGPLRDRREGGSPGFGHRDASEI